MKKSKTKSILACAVLASVMAVGNVAWARTYVTAVYSADDTPHTETGIFHDNVTFRLKWGNNSDAVGNGATAWGGYKNGSISENGGTASGDASTAFGVKTQALGWMSTAWGKSTIAKTEGATAWGYSTTASGQYSTAWGLSTEASGYGSTAWGQSTSATNYYSTAWGGGSTASGNYSTAWGKQTYAGGEISTAFGNQSIAGGENSLAALGGVTGTWEKEPMYDYYDGWADGTLSTEQGKTGKNAVAIGEGAHAKVDNSVAIGQYAVTTLGSISADETNKIKFNEFSVGGGTKDGYTYLSRITGVADGANDYDAVNKGQLDVAVAAGGSKVELKSGETNLTLDDGTGTDAGKKILSLKDTLSLTSVTTTGNVSVGGTLSVTGNATMSGTLGVTGAVTAGSFKIDDDNLWDKNSGLKAAKVTVGNVVISNNKITGLADGSTAKDSKEAVNGGQLYTATHMGSTAGKNYDANATVVTAVGKLDTVVGNSNGGLVKDVTALQTTVGDSASGLVKGVVDNKAAIAEYKIKDLGTGETNLVLNSGKLTLKTTVDLTSSGSLTIGNSVLSNTGLAITGGPSLTTTSGLYIANGNTWTTNGALTATSIATTTGTFGSKVTISADGIVAPMYKIDGNNLWDVTNGLKATKATFGGVVTINDSGIAMGSKKITGLANGTDATDAVNKGQLDAAVAGLSDVMSSDNDSKKLVADGVVAPSTTDKSGHIVTGKTVYEVMYSAVGNAFTGVNGSKGLRYDNTGDGKLVANVAFEGTNATFSGSLKIKDASEGYAVTIDQNGIVAPAYKVGTATYIDSNGLNANSQVIKNVSAQTLAENGTYAATTGQLYTEQQARIAATTMSAAGNNYAVNTSVTNAVKALDTALGTYNYDGMKNNNYANTGVVATDVKNLDTQVKTNTDAIAAINNAETGVLKTAKDYTDDLASGQVTTNKTDIATLKTTVGDASSGLIKTVEDNRNTLQGQIDSIKSTGDKLGVYYENNELLNEKRNAQKRLLLNLQNCI